MSSKIELPKRTLFCDTLGACCQVTDENCKQCEFYKETFKRTTKDILAERERLLKKYGDITAVQLYFNIISEMIFRMGVFTTPDDYLRH